MTLLPTLIVAVMAAGGPAHAGPVRLTDATVTVSHGGVRLASSDDGEIRARLAPGTYEVQAWLGPPHVNIARKCQSRQVRITRTTVRMRLTLTCSVK